MTELRKLREFVGTFRSSTSEKTIAARFIRTLSEKEVERLAEKYIAELVWGIKRENQRAVEQKSQRVKPQENRETAQEKQARLEKEVAEFSRRLDEKYERDKIEAEKMDEEFLPILLDSSLVEDDLLFNPKSDAAKVFYEWASLRGAWYRDDFRTAHPERFRIDHGLCLFLIDALEYRNVPQQEWSSTLIKHGCASSILSLHIHLQIEEASKQIRLDLTEELLLSEFAVGDGDRVTWADATVDQHAQRAAMTTRNAQGNAEDAARHLAAVELLRNSNTPTLGSLAQKTAA